MPRKLDPHHPVTEGGAGPSNARRLLRRGRSWLINRGAEGVLIADKREQLRRFGSATVNKLLTLTAMVFNYAVRHNWTASNPAACIEKVKRPAREKEEEQALALEAGEVQRLIAAAHEPWRVILPTAVKTGLRQSELLGLRWADIDFDAGLLHVRRSFRLGSFYDPKSRTSRRRGPLSRELMLELKRWKLICPRALQADGQRRLDLVFPTTEGNPQSPSNLISRGLAPALKRAHLRRIRFHDLRHTVRESSPGCWRGSENRLDAHGAFVHQRDGRHLRTHAEGRRSRRNRASRRRVW